MSSTAGHAAEPSLSLHPRVGQAAIACLVAAGAGVLAGDASAGALGAAAAAIPAAGSALALARIGRQAASLMAAVALAAPCVRLTVSVVLASALWLGCEELGVRLGAGAFWAAFMLAALGTLAVETLGFAADFRALSHAEAHPIPTTRPVTETAPS